jgi:hypothetical protein
MPVIAVVLDRIAPERGGVGADQSRLGFAI